MPRLSFYVLISGIFLTSCAVQPDYRRPEVELPAAWRKSADNPTKDGRWWRVYADPVLEALVAEALERNSNLLVAAARVDESRALLQQTSAAQLPAVDGAFGRNRTLSSAATGLLPQ